MKTSGSHTLRLREDIQLVLDLTIYYFDVNWEYLGIKEVQREEIDLPEPPIYAPPLELYELAEICGDVSFKEYMTDQQPRIVVVQEGTRYIVIKGWYLLAFEEQLYEPDSILAHVIICREEE